MMDNKENILDYFPEDYEDSAGFDKDDKIVLARIFMDSEEAQMAVVCSSTMINSNHHGVMALTYCINDGHDIHSLHPRDDYKSSRSK